VPQILSKADLDKLTCSDEGCEKKGCSDTLWFHAACHPADPTWVAYKDGVLTISCGNFSCENVVCTIGIPSAS
jgi:hypothetical protein